MGAPLAAQLHALTRECAVADEVPGADVLVDVTLPSDEKMPGIILLGIAAAVLVIVVIAIAVLATGRNGPKKGVKEGYEKTRESDSEGWERYYNKK